MTITTCPTAIVRIESWTPSTWKSRKSESPSTTSGITSGTSRSVVAAPRPRKRLRLMPIEARIPSATAMILVMVATIALVSSAACRSPLWRKAWYQRSVKPLSGKAGMSALLKEKTRRIAIGA